MRICVFGTGGVGGYFGGLLARSGAEVTFIARGEHLRALRARGLTLRTVQDRFTIPAKAADEPRTPRPVDLVLFCVKSYDTESAGRALPDLLALRVLREWPELQDQRPSSSDSRACSSTSTGQCYDPRRLRSSTS